MANFKKLPIVKTFYHIPGLAPTYHFLWAWTGARIHRAPSKRIFVIGITGTKGKTTTIELLNAILESAGKKTALLSSLRAKIGDETTKNVFGNSMPGRGFIQKFLARAVRAGCEYALIEVTSQGVVAHRHRFIDWHIGVLTNLAPEHIEAHGSFENYRAAKLGFLKYVLRHGGEVFLNRDDDKYFPFFSAALEGGKTSAASRLDHPLRNAAHSEKFLLSKFNEENIAIAVAIAKRLGIPDESIERALASFAGVPGRMEFLTKGPFTAVVDYAHTPDSLEAAYKAVRPAPSAEYAHPRLIGILGAAGGGRDRWKRKAMGEIAAQYCDELILTDEDPYDEDPRAILEEIKSGIAASGHTPRVFEMLDRREAIKKAVELMGAGDVVIATGKGSEDWIHIGRGKKIPWNERSIFEEVMAGKELLK